MISVLYIAAHEIRRLFKNSMAWIMLAVVQFVLAIFFFLIISQFINSSSFANYGVTEIVVVGFLQIAGVMLLLIVPFITMRTFSEERQTGSIKLLLSSPISISELVLGKYLGILCYLLVLLVTIMLMPLSLLLGTDIDLLQLLSAFLALLLLTSSFVAIGLFVSSLASQPVIAAVSTFGILLMLWIINVAANTSSALLGDIFSYMSLLSHYHDLLDGVLNSTDIIYYLLVSTVFIILSIWYLDNERI